MRQTAQLGESKDTKVLARNLWKAEEDKNKMKENWEWDELGRIWCQWC
jgi:hypothetical protein